MGIACCIIWFPLCLVVGTVLFMEWFAAWSHEHIMHGWGWGWHKSHHEPHDETLEENDLYAVVFAAFAVSLFWVGANWFWPIWWIADRHLDLRGAVFLHA
jgi:beta-carotene 3-hydroxylase